MTKTLPSFYSLSIDNLKEKFSYYDSIDLHELPIKTPSYMMQSLILSKSRYNFYIDRGEEVSIDSYNKLFIREKEFIRKYGLTNKELIDKYYEGEKSNDRTL